MEEQIEGQRNEIELRSLIVDDSVATTTSPAKVIVVEGETRHQPSFSQKPYFLGRIFVFLPHLFRRTGYGIIGPHVCGLAFTWTLLFTVSLYLIKRTRHTIGTGTSLVCSAFGVLVAVNLIRVSNRDPGIVVTTDTTTLCSEEGEEEEMVTAQGGRYKQHGHNEEVIMNKRRRQNKYCAYCKMFQPKTAVHCPDCNVCIEGYDHHCPWMGICIGKKNMRAFLAFNLSWLSYLLYLIIWVSIMAPKLQKE